MLLLFLLLVLRVSSENCRQMNFKIYCWLEPYDGPVWIKILDRSPLFGTNTLYETYFEETDLSGFVHIDADLTKVEDCEEVKPKLIITTQCEKPLTYQVYGIQYPIELARRKLTGEENLKFKSEYLLNNINDLHKFHENWIDMKDGDYGITELFS